jgi:hypothetical protein
MSEGKGGGKEEKEKFTGRRGDTKEVGRRCVCLVLVAGAKYNEGRGNKSDCAGN